MTRGGADDMTPLLERYVATAPDDPARERLREQLVIGFLPLVRSVAHRFAGRGESREDLEQVASVGLLGALERYDPGRGPDFLAFAVPTMMGEVRRYFRDHSWVLRTPRRIKDRYVALGAATTRLSHELGRAPTLDELAEHLEWSRADVAETAAARSSLRPTSLDAPFGHDDGAVAGDFLAESDTRLELVELRADVADLVSELPDRERHILVLRFVHDKTQSEIADVVSISQMHVSRLLARTLRELRERQAGIGR